MVLVLVLPHAPHGVFVERAYAQSGVLLGRRREEEETVLEDFEEARVCALCGGFGLGRVRIEPSSSTEEVSDRVHSWGGGGGEVNNSSRQAASF